MRFLGSCPVEVHHILIENTLELLVAEDQQVVQAFLPHAPQEALADGIGSGCMNRRFEDLDRARFRHTSKTRSKLAIVIPNQIFWRLPIRGRFSQLLRDPGIGRGSCDSHVNHLARLQLDNEEREEWSKEEISDLQEVTRPDLSCVVAQKGCPLLTSWLLGAITSHVLLDGALADIDAQFQ